jgi:hypothetical protein
MKSFFQIDRKYINLVNLLTENEGEVTDEIAELMSINKSDVNSVVEEHVAIIQMLESDNENLKNNIELLKNRVVSNEIILKRFKEGLVFAINRYGEGKLKTSKYNLSLRKSKALEVIDDSMIHSRYFKWELTTKLNNDLKREVSALLAKHSLTFKYTIDKVAIKKDFEEGQIAKTGFDVIEKDNLVIK